MKEEVIIDGIKYIPVNKAEEYLASLQEFKVGDIVEINETGLAKILNIEGEFYYTDWSRIGFNKHCLKLANDELIIEYYQNQGWVLGAKFKYLGEILIIDCVYFDETHKKWKLKSISESRNGFFKYDFDECELIKEPELPKSWEELKDIEGWFIGINGRVYEEDSKYKERNVFSTEKQAKSALAFAQLSQLVKALNGDWEYEWTGKNLYDNGKHNPNKLWTVIRATNNLEVNFKTTHFCHLVFKTKELAEFSLLNHKELWEQYYEL